MKRLITTVMFVALVFSLCACDGSEYFHVLDYELNDNGNYYIVTGIGKFKDSDLHIPVEHKNLPVKEIADRAFEGCGNLKTVTMSSIITVGDSAFSGCDNLTSIIMDGVITLGKNAFSGCGSLERLRIPVDHIECISDMYSLKTLMLTSVDETAIPPGAFRDFTNLQNICIEEGITSIGDSVFRNCVSLEEVTLPNSLTSIGDNAFSGCELLLAITIPASVKMIRAHAFADSGLLSISLETTSGWTAKSNNMLVNDVSMDKYFSSSITAATLLTQPYKYLSSHDYLTHD